MSKVSEAKEAQGWSKTPASCGNCVHFKSEIVKKTYQRHNGAAGAAVWSVEKNLRCGIGEFKVGKSNVCDRFERKGAA